VELETFSAVATIISAIATVIAAIATAIAARASRAAADEAKKSNEISKKEINKRERPVLDLPTKHFSAKLGSDFFSQWEDGDPDHKINRASDFYLDLYNISDTTARNVVMTFEREHTNEAVKELLVDGKWCSSGKQLGVKHTEYEGRFNLLFYDKDAYKDKIAPIATMTEALGSIYPIKYNNESTKVHIPIYFTYLMNFVCNDISIYEKQHKISLLLTLKYSDPSNKKEYIQKIRLRPMFKKIIKNRNGEGVSFFGRLISEEISNKEIIMAE